MAGDRRAWPLTVAGTDGLRRVVGRVLVARNGKPVEILIDDPEAMEKIVHKLEEGSFQIRVV